MAYGQFTDYAPHPEIPGAYQFNTAGGQPMVFGGPAADELKARLDAANAAGMTADNSAPADNGPGLLSRAGDAVSQFAKNITTPTKSDAGGSPPPSAGLTPVMSNGLQTGYLKDENGKLYKQTAGTAGVSQEQLQKKATQGVATPTSESTTVQGARPVNEDYIIDRKLQNQAEGDAMEGQRQAELSANEAGRQMEAERLAFVNGQQQQQQAQVNAIQQQVQQAQAVRDQALKDYSSTKIDPNRVFSGGEGVLKAIGAALAAGAGAWGATIGHTQNFAQQIIDQAINRDINAQEADLRTKKDTADNALADLTRRGMSLDQAKNTLATIQNNYWMGKVQAAKAASGNDAINAKWDQQMAQFAKKNADFEQAYRDDAMGKATQSVTSRVMYPQAGSAGGLVAVSPHEAGTVIKDTAGTEGTIAGTAKTVGEIGKAAGEGGAQDKKVEAAGATVEGMRKLLSKYKPGDVPQVPENQNLADRVVRTGQDFLMGEGSYARGMPERDRDMIQDTEAARGAVRSLTSVLSGQGALSGPETEIANKGMAPGATVGETDRALAILQDRINNIQKGGK